MSHRNFSIASIVALSLCCAAPSLHAQNMDVDQADTIDFESFHKDKKEAIKVWDKKSDTTTKAYSDQVSDKTAKPSAAAASGNAAAASREAITTPVSTADAKGRRFEIRERYTLTRSTQTPYSAFYVIEPLYKQAAQLCPRGWKKLSERSEPIESDYYLYFEIECL